MKCPLCSDNFDSTAGEDGLHIHMARQHPEYSKTLIVHSICMDGRAEGTLADGSKQTCTAITVLGLSDLTPQLEYRDVEFRALALNPAQTEWFVDHLKIAMDQQAGLVEHEKPQRSRWNWWRALRARWGL